MIALLAVLFGFIIGSIVMGLMAYLEDRRAKKPEPIPGKDYPYPYG